LKNDAPIDEATNAIFHLDELSQDDSGSYTCQVTDNTLTLKADPVQIQVFPAGSVPVGMAAVAAMAAALAFIGYRVSGVKKR